ncbi:hypothetical protein ACXWTF_13080 [Thiomicrolovo sp. ZZH C-3]
MTIPEGYSLLYPMTDTGLSRAMVYYKLQLTRGGLFIFLREDKETPKSMTSDINAVLHDLITAGVHGIEHAPIIFKNGELSYDGISIDPFGNVNFYAIGGLSEDEAVDNYMVRHGTSLGL